MLRFLSAAVLVVAAQFAFAADPSSMVDFRPEANPIVIEANVTIGHGSNKLFVKGPWFHYRSETINNSSLDLILTGYTFVVTGNKKGRVSTVKYIYEISDGLFCSANSVCPEIKSIYLDELPANDGYVYDVKIKVEGWFEDQTGRIVHRYNGIGTQKTR
jgi:hypothetical protein